MRERARDSVSSAIAVGSVIMFVGTGSMVLPPLVRRWLGTGAGPDLFVTIALLLNIALIVFGLLRYRDLKDAIRHHRQAESHARQLAETDDLTGCLNRRSIGPATDALLAQSNAEGAAVAFLIVDLDDFKQINDMNGHQMGDELLRVVADRLRALMPDGGLVARLGGDEFSCVVPYRAGRSDMIDHLAALLIEKVAEPVALDGLSCEITMSVGLASSELEPAECESGIDATALMHRADIAMYHAKRKGKNRHFWFAHSMENELRFRNELEAGIRKGLREGEFQPYYEQQVDLDSGELMGFEMLARWASPELGLVSPTVFIPIAEEIGLIGELSDQLLAAAFEDAKTWAPQLSLSINISPVQLRDPWFSQRLLKTMAQHNFPARRLDVEITESCLHENVGMVRSIITSLRNQGVRISLDDFGTGYSSLAQLRTLPFDRLKIDRSFVAELSDDDSGSEIVDAIVTLGAGLDLPITAEGIENTRILNKLRQKGQLKGQGYLYGRPENGLDTARRLAKMNLLLTPLDEIEGSHAAAMTVAPEEAEGVQSEARTA